MDIAEQLKELAAQYGLVYRGGTSPERMPETYVYSKDMRYRYAFTRWWSEGSLALWVMLNPTTRDTRGGQRRTLRRCIEFSRLWGHAGLIVGNLFALRLNDPKDLPKAVDPIGPLNDTILESLDAIADRTIVVWGYRSWLHRRSADVRALVREPHCLGTTGSGQPRHPLYLPSDAHLQPWVTPSSHHPMTPIGRRGGAEIVNNRAPRYDKEWQDIGPATRKPTVGTQAERLFRSLDETPTSYRQLWQRAGFQKDPYLRTNLRKWAKAAEVDRIVNADGTELWSLPATESRTGLRR
jgi:hypothetical protein